MRRRSVKNTFSVGDQIKTPEGHEGKIVALWDDLLKIQFSTGPRERMSPLVIHFSHVKPA